MERKSNTKGLPYPNNEDTVECSSDGQARVFQGVRFFLVGFDPSAEIQYSTELENNGGFNVGRYDTSCSHVIVHRLTYDDPICLTTRKDKKILVTDWWVADSLDLGMPADPTRILYRPVKDFNGIPGSKSLCLCLTGYQSQDRSDIMRMVDMMGARFTKPLIAKEVTHLICYKFEGDKYKLAKQMGLKLENHRWLEDCLKAWELLPEDNYNKSGWELEILESQAGDSEDDGVGKIGSPTPSRPTIKPGNLFRSPRKSLGTSSPTTLQVISNKKLNTPKYSSKTISEANIDGAQHENKDILGLQSRGTPSSTKCDLGTLLAKKAELNKYSDGNAKGLHLREGSHVDSALLNQEGGTEIGISAEETKSVYIEGMALPEDIPTLGVKVSDVANLSKTPQRTDISDVTRTGRIETPVDSAQGRNLLGRMGKDDIKNVPSPVENNISNGLVKIGSGRADENIHPRDGEATEVNGKKSIAANATEVNQHSHTDLARRVDIDYELKTPSERTKTHICQDGLSVGSNLAFKKATTANGGVDLSNSSSILNDASGTGKTNGHVEEISKKPFVSSDNNLHMENYDASNLGIGNPCDNVDRNGQKTCDDVSANEVLLSGVVTPNTDCQIESSIGGKRKRQSKVCVPNKKKNTMPGGQLMSSSKTMPLQSGEVSHQEELHKMELIAEKENINDGMPDKAFKMPSQHAPGNLNSKTPNSAASLQSFATNDNSGLPKKRGRKQGVNKKAEANEGPRLVVANQTGKEEAGLIDLNVPNERGFIFNPQVEHLADGEHGVYPDLICDAAELKSDALGDHQHQFFEEGSTTANRFISKREIDSSATKPEVITPNEKPRKRGRPPAKKGKSSEFVEKLNPVISDAVAQDKSNDAEAQARGIDKCLASMTGATISEVGSPNQKHKYDIVLTPRAADVEGPGSVERPWCNNRMDSSPYTPNDKQRHGYESVHQHSNNSSPDGKGTFEVEQNLQVSGDCERQKQVQSKDAEDFVLGTPQDVVSDVLQISQCNNEGKNSCNKKSGSSKQKKSKSGENITYTNEMKASSVEPVHDKRQKMSNVNRAAKAKSGKLANRKKSIKATKRSSLGYENGTSKEVKDVTQIAKEESSKMLPESVQRWFLLSGHRLQRKELQQLIKSLGGKPLKDSHQWSYQATHLVVPEPLRRTEKFFAAVAAGRWVLTTEYLTASKQAGRFLDEQEYEWHKSGLNEDGTISFDAPRKWRLYRENTGHGALHGFRIIVYGECIAPTLDTVKRVVKAGGGLILATSPPYNRSLSAGVDFAVVSPGVPRDDLWIQEFLRHNIACVLVDYLVEYVCKPSYPLDKHVLYNTHEAVDKFMKNMEMNIQLTPSSNLSRHTTLIESKAQMKEEEVEKKEGHVSEISCSVCGSADRDDVMLLCGDEQGRGCGIAMHIDCCKPPFENVPEEDWFCYKCQSLTDLTKSSKAKKTKKS